MRPIIAWFVDNPVAANLLMGIFLFGGALALLTVYQEEFPAIDPDVVQISVPYLGAAPQEVEDGVCVRIEEAVDGIDGIEKIRTYANEGNCRVILELVSDGDSISALNEIKSKVDGISTFPKETENPIVSKFTFRGQVMNVAVAGNVSERTLKELAQEVRDDIVGLPSVTQADVNYIRPYEISIEVSEYALRRHNLTLEQVADAIRRTSLDLPGGSIKTDGGEILLRTKGQAYVGHEFEDIVVLTRDDGTRVHLAEIARVVDGFEEGDLRARFNGKNAAMVKVARVGTEDLVDIARDVRQYIKDKQRTLPEGIELTVWMDSSEELTARLDTLVSTAVGGLVLVLIILTLFLRFRLALWVAAGIPIAIAGTLMVFPYVGFSISSLTVMAFILVLGIVVDDAIVVGERVHAHEEAGASPRDAAVNGTYEVAVPVIFGVLTTMAAFLPLTMGSGRMGDFFGVIGYVVMIALVFSILESQLILPAHLAHRSRKRRASGKSGLRARWERAQDALSQSLTRFADQVYRPFLIRAIEWRYTTATAALCVLLIVVVLIASGRVVFSFFPSIEGDTIYATLTMPEGVDSATTMAGAERIERALQQLRAEVDVGRPEGAPSVIQNVMSSVGVKIERDGPPRPSGPPQSHVAEVAVELLPLSERGGMSSTDIARRWGELTGPIPDAVELSFTAAAFSAGEPINFELRGRNVDNLRQAAAELRAELTRWNGVRDITDSFRAGKQEIKLALKPEGRNFGLTLNDLGSQVRGAFYGVEAQRIQRGEDDVRVMVRYPEAERKSIGNLEDMRIRTSDGTEVPFSAVAEYTIGRGYSTIQRVNGQRVVHVTADIDRGVATPERVISEISRTTLPEIAKRYDVDWGLAGEQEERAKAMLGLAVAAVMALFIIYALLAVPLRSYLQPLVIMSVIPFGAVGAITGHYIMNWQLMFFSLLGIVALSGVVVNASLVLVDYINRRRTEGIAVWDAVTMAGVSRFRPIILTSVTTFVGLIPLMALADPSTAFIIPMAISLAYGVMFATVITLILVPCLYMILEDFNALMGTDYDPRWSQDPDGEPEGLTAG